MNRLFRISPAVFLLAACTCTPAPAAIHVQPVIAADQPAAEAVGQSVLADGGSAADAAVATLLALGVENPSSSGIGGGGFAVIWDAKEGRAYSLDFRESAPAGASLDHYRSPDGNIDPKRSRLGCYSAGVPGEIAGLTALHQRFGKLSWERVVTPAEKMAANGVAISPYLGNALIENRADLEKSPALRELFMHDGRWLATGENFRNEDLANTLGQIARDGGKSFYQGSIAASIAAACRDVEGGIRAEDLAAYHPIWRAPIVAHWRGDDIITVPPPSSGGVVLVEMLHILEPVKFNRNGADAAQSYHLLVEAMKHGFADRATSFGDPDFVEVPVDELTSVGYADKLRSTIDGARTKPHGFYGHPGIHSSTEDHGTTNVSVIDADGNAIAITSSVNFEFGSMVVAPQTGVLLNDTIDDFSFGQSSNIYGLVGSEKNILETGKRPVSSMTPTIVLHDKKVRLVAGGAGGPRITSGVLQTVLGVIAEEKSVDDAVDAPRVHHQWTPDVLKMEPQIPKTIAGDLEKRGNTLEAASYLGVVTAVELKDGKSDAAIDSRKSNPAPETAPAQPAATAPSKKPSPAAKGPK